MSVYAFAVAYLIAGLIVVKTYWLVPRNTQEHVRWMFIAMITFFGLTVGEVFFRDEPKTFMIALNSLNAVLAAVNINLTFKCMEFEEQNKRLDDWRNKG